VARARPGGGSQPGAFAFPLPAAPALMHREATRAIGMIAFRHDGHMTVDIVAYPATKQPLSTPITRAHAATLRSSEGALCGVGIATAPNQDVEHNAV
jgi:hypothetical protein